MPPKFTPTVSVVYTCDAVCNCFGHADSCFYDAAVASFIPSLNAAGVRSGGGVCVDCRHNTTGNSDVSHVIVFLTCGTLLVGSRMVAETKCTPFCFLMVQSDIVLQLHGVNGFNSHENSILATDFTARLKCF